MIDKLPPQARIAGDAGTWAAVLVGAFSDYSTALNGLACLLAAIWTALQIYSWGRTKLKARRKKSKK